MRRHAMHRARIVPCVPVDWPSCRGVLVQGTKVKGGCGCAHPSATVNLTPVTRR
jgi:hypothetical protein